MGATGIDVASLLKKMRVEVDDFRIETEANLTDEHPRYYDKVRLIYSFTGKGMDEDKIRKAVDLSKDKYCGVYEMFRQFAEIETIINITNH